MKYKSIGVGIAMVLILSANLVLAQESNTWYAGKGAKEGLLLKYSIVGLVTNNNNVQFTLWFRDLDSNGNWNVYMILEGQGIVVDGWAKLSSKDLTPQSADDKLQTNIDLFKSSAIDIFKNSLAWIRTFANSESPRSLNVGSVWGRIGAIGAGSMGVSGKERIEAPPGQTWDTSVVSWLYGAMSSLWIAENAPLPIKALVYASTTQQPIPIQFQFELIDYKITSTKPEPPKPQVVLPEPPLEAKTPTQQYTIRLYWDPKVIEPGKTIKIAPAILDTATLQPIPNVKYNLTIRDEEGKIIFNEQVVAENGLHTHEVVFPKNGNYKVTVTLAQVTALGGVTGEIGIVEKADFNLVVVPEFPISALLAMASVISVVIIISRFRGWINV